MAYDGIFIKAQIKEIKTMLQFEHIAKITQKSPKEINFHIRKNSKNYILTLSANPNFPYMLLNDKPLENLSTPPAFCMLVRKYLQGARFIDIQQIGKRFLNKVDENLYLERIVKFEFENIDEYGDKQTYFLYFEIMGKYSNIIVTDSNNIILDVLIKSSIENKRLNIKEKYNVKDIANKNEIFFDTFDDFISNINEVMALSSINDEVFDLAGGIAKKYAGLSKALITSIIFEYLASNRIRTISNGLKYKLINKYIKDKESFASFYQYLKEYISNIVSKKTYTPVINYKGNNPADFYLFKLYTYEGDLVYTNTLNECVDKFIEVKYKEINDTSEKKNLQSIVKSLYTKLNKKLDIYKKDLAKCDNMETIRNYGELVSAFGYNLEDIKDGILTCKDYNHNDEIVKIPIDESLTVAKNVERYYDQYDKLKRTKENAEKLIAEANEKIEHLNTISHSLELPNDKNDLYLIKEEILKYFGEANKIHSLNKHKKDISTRKNSKKNTKDKLNYNIHHYKSSSGIDIYAGKNNLQNEYLTFTLAEPMDTWLHIKDSTGSHVIIKGSYEKIDEQTLIEAASLAAYFSDKKNETKATVDYTYRKELKKVKGKTPGFCIYHKNYSINVKPGIFIKEI